jgi:hypothetical protein
LSFAFLAVSVSLDVAFVSRFLSTFFSGASKRDDEDL